MSFQIIPRVTLYILFTLICAALSVNAQSLDTMFTMGQVKTVRTSLPSTSEDIMDMAKWIEYGIFLAIILAIPVIVGVGGYLATMIFCCCRCCGFCGSNVPTKSEAYKRKHLLVPAVVLACIYAGFIVLAIVGVIFSAQGSTHVRVMLDETFVIIDSVTTTLNNVNNLPTVIVKKLNALPDALDPLLNKALNATSPLNTISTLVGNTVTQLSSFNSTTIENMDKEVTNIKNGIDILRNSSKLSGVPPSSDIPNIKATISPSISSGLTAITAAKTQIDSGKDSVLSKISSVKILINDTVATQLTPSISQAVGGIQQPLAQIQSQINTYLNNQTITDAKTYSKLAENIRVALSIGLFCWCAIIYIFVFLGLIFRKTCCVHFTSVLAFITAWVFIVLAAIQIPAFIFINEACTNGPKVIGTAGDKVLTSMIPSGMGIKLQNVSDMLTSLSTCKADQSLLNVLLGNNALSALGISSMLSGVTDTFGTQAKLFNISSITDSAKSSMTSSAIGSINVDYTSDLIAARAKLANGTAALNNIAGFTGFNATEFDAALNALNAFTNQMIGQNYTYANFETFNENQFANAGDRTQAGTLKNATRLQHSIQTTALAEISYYNSTLNMINSNMDSLIANVASSKTLVSSLGTLTTSIVAQIDLLTSNVQNFITTFPDEAIAFVLSFANGLITSIGSEIAGCAFIATYITATDTAVCKGISLELLITGIVCFFIGLLMHIGCVVNVVIAKRIKYQSGNRVHPNLSTEMN